MKALVFGSKGQLGSYMVELLLKKNYEVTSVSRKAFDFESKTQDFDGTIVWLLKTHKPDEIYNFAGLLNAEQSWESPFSYMKVNGEAVLALLQIVQDVLPEAKVFTAGSAEVFEKGTIRQYEDTNRLPANPYGLSKLVAMEAVRLYREKYGMFVCTGILFNAESPRRKKEFFAERVAYEVAKFQRDFQRGDWKPMQFGKLSALRDWGWAPEYVEVAWKMLQATKAEDYVIGTSEVHTCREFVEEALKVAGFTNLEERFDKYVFYEKQAETLKDCMQAIPIKAKMCLDWEAKVRFKDVVRMLVEAEMGLGKSAAAG